MLKLAKKLPTNYKKLMTAGIGLFILGLILLIPSCNLLYSGETLHEVDVSVNQEVSSSVAVTKPSPKGVNLSVKIDCPQRERSNRKKGAFHYPFEYRVINKQGEVLLQKSGVLSSDSDNTASNRMSRISIGFTDGKRIRLSTAGIFETFWTRIGSFNAEEPGIYTIKFLIKQDSKYSSKLVGSKVVIVEGLKADRYPPLLSGVAMLMAGIFILLFIVVKHGNF